MAEVQLVKEFRFQGHGPRRNSTFTSTAWSCWGPGTQYSPFAQHKTNLVVLIWMDNSSAVTYINHMGGTRSTVLAEIAIQFWTWALQRGIILKARHIAGVENVTADKMSRIIVRDRSDWKLNPVIFSRISSLWGPLHVDMFATRLSTLLPRFFSWKPEPQAEATDAFLQDWSAIQGYAHPPWCLIQRCLKKVVLQKATLVMITPLWSTQSWFPTILSA